MAHIELKKRIVFTEHGYGNWVLFGGQVRTLGKKVEGFVRAVSQYGEVYEGGFKDGQKDGWGRMISADGSYQIGWWKNGWLYGNSRKFLRDGQVDQEGWFEDYSTYKGGFKKITSDYKYWDMRDQYFIRV